MLYIVYQIDGPDSPEVRTATREAHFKYLDQHEDILVLGGAMLADELAAEQPTGGSSISSCQSSHEDEYSS